MCGFSFNFSPWPLSVASATNMRFVYIGPDVMLVVVLNIQLYIFLRDVIFKAVPLLFNSWSIFHVARQITAGHSSSVE